MEILGELEGLTEEHKKLLCSMINRYSGEVEQVEWKREPHYEYSGVGQHPIADLDTLKYFDSLYAFDTCNLVSEKHRDLLADEGLKLLDDLCTYLNVFTCKYEMRTWDGSSWSPYEEYIGEEIIRENAEDPEYLWEIINTLPIVTSWGGKEIGDTKLYGGGALEWIEFTLRG